MRFHFHKATVRMSITIFAWYTQFRANTTWCRTAVVWPTLHGQARLLRRDTAGALKKTQRSHHADAVDVGEQNASWLKVGARVCKHVGKRVSKCCRATHMCEHAICVGDQDLP